MKKINKNLIAVLLIIFLSIIAYGNIFLNDFVWDDYVFILENPDIKSFSNAPKFFMQSVDGLYRPLRSIHYTAVYSIFKKNPFGYHLNALFFHIIISILVYFIILKLTNKNTIALVSSLLFALHPIHTERVANMTAGFDLLGIFLYLLAFYFYILFSSEEKGSAKRVYFFLSIIVFIIGLLASEEIVTLPLAIILYEFSFNREKFKEKIKKNILKIYLPFFAIALFYIIFRFFVLGIQGRVPEYESPGLYFTSITMAKVFINYILLLIFPFSLKLFYEVKIAASILDFSILISVIVLALILFFTIKHYNKIIFFCVFWFFIALLPMSNVIPLVVLMAERYLYLASFGFAFLLGFVFDRIYNLNFEKNIKKNIRIGAIVFLVLLLLFYSFVVIKRNAEWKDNLTLWTETVKDSPNSSRAYDNLGFTYEQMGKYKDAMREFGRAIELNPGNYKAHTNLGVVLYKVGLYNFSILEFETAIKINPYYYKTYNKLGLVYFEIGDYKNAVFMLNNAVKLNPDYAKGYNDLGMVYGQLGVFNASLEAFKKAIKIDNDYGDAHYNLGVLYEFLGERSLALKELRIAASLEPKNELYKRKLGEVV